MFRPLISRRVKQLCSKRDLSHEWKSEIRVATLITKGRWKSLQAYLRTEEGEEEAAHFDRLTGHTGMTALHLACQFHPPLDVVQRLDEIWSTAVSQSNCIGHTPLHVAAANGASSAVVQYLISQYPPSVELQDDSGKTPLILLCEKGRYEMEPVSTDDIGLHNDEPIWCEVRSAAKALCDASPSTVIAEDLSGASALEYAITTRSDWNVVGFLMKKTKQQRLVQVKQVQAEWRAQLQPFSPTSSIRTASAA